MSTARESCTVDCIGLSKLGRLSSGILWIGANCNNLTADEAGRAVEHGALCNSSLYKNLRAERDAEWVMELHFQFTGLRVHILPL